MQQNFYHMLTNEEIARIHEASLEVLQNTGLKIDHPVAQERLAAVGARVDAAGQRVYIPKELVEKALKTVTRGFTCAGRTEAYDFLSGEGNEHRMPTFRTVGGAMNLYNLSTNTIRPLTIADCGDMAHLVDAMENLNILGALTPTDIQLETYEIETMKVMLERGRKHVWALTTDSKKLKFQLEMMVAMAGSKDALKKRPMCSGIVCMIEPLFIPYDEIERLLMYGEYNLPIRVPFTPMIGANAPYTLAGTITQTNAEALGTQVVLQTLCPGIPNWYYDLVQSMEMSGSGTQFLNPEVTLVETALLQLSRHYGIPSSASSVMGCNCQSHQILFERGTSLTMAAMAGINEVGGMGGIENGMATCPQMIVMDNEIIAYNKRLLQGVDINEETMATEVIHRDDHRGKYLEDPHTLTHLRKEARFRPSLLDWRPLMDWEKDQRTIVDRAEEKRAAIMDHHTVPPLEEKLGVELNRILDAAKKELVA
jgi:trimethylamine---corrinoid protein Co-methyltransferase